MAKIKLLKNIGANLIIIVSLMIMVRTHLDKASPLVYDIYRPITHIQSFFSFYQNWSMFSPNPSRINAYVDAVIEFKDGKSEKYEFLRPDRSQLFQRYLFGERFRKYFAEGIRMDSYSYLWAPAAHYIFNDVKDKYADRKIQKIILRRHWYSIPDWKTKFIPFTEDAQVEVQSFNFYTWDIKNELK